VPSRRKYSRSEVVTRWVTAAVCFAAAVYFTYQSITDHGNAVGHVFTAYAAFWVGKNEIWRFSSPRTLLTCVAWRWRPSVEAFIREVTEEYTKRIADGTPTWLAKLNVAFQVAQLAIGFTCGSAWRTLVGFIMGRIVGP
jgi:hypothetical protein